MVSARLVHASFTFGSQVTAFNVALLFAIALAVHHGALLLTAQYRTEGDPSSRRLRVVAKGLNQTLLFGIVVPTDSHRLGWQNQKTKILPREMVCGVAAQGFQKAVLRSELSAPLVV